MKDKSDGNLRAAQSLINNGFGTASVHCSYYAVLQYMKYVLAKVSSPTISYSQQDNDVKNDYSKSSHDYVLSEVCHRIPDYRKAKDFKESVKELKQARVIADYKEGVFSTEEGIDYRNKADTLIHNLRSFF